MESPAPPVLNNSPNDFVARSAVARRSVWEKYLRTEWEFCERFGYIDLPEQLIEADSLPARSWFPTFESRTFAPLEIDQLGENRSKYGAGR